MKKFHLTEKYCLINFDASIYDSIVNIIQSDSFELVLNQFIKHLEEENNQILLELNNIENSEILSIYKLLLIYDFDEMINNNNNNLTYLPKIREALYSFTEMFYDYWRSLERFGLMQAPKQYDSQARTAELIKTADQFNEVVLFLYRTLSQKLMNNSFSVYRQLPAGINANLLFVQHRFSDNKEFANLQNIGFVTNILTRPPFIFYTKSNKRSGYFQELKENPLSSLDINRLHYLVFPVKVGKLLAYVYIHRDFLHHGIGISNLFELAKFEYYKNKKPDLIYIYGIKENEYDCKYYHDKEENIYFGYVSRLDKNDYFGYLKKMLLTLHNLYMLDHGNLPLHGAMVSVVLKDDSTKNIVLIGDSGAGKSETLEALRLIGKEHIKQMRVVFDDMGTLMFHEGKVVATGTEIGAFIRLDDLDAGYAYQEMDRAIFLNPNQKNSRVIIPISQYNYIIKQHKIDLFLYANNYEDKNLVRAFENIEDALLTFKKGLRLAKGTTSEVGLVSSYFANPFGPLQAKEKTDILLNKYFKALQEQKIILGELYTKLALEGKEASGPKDAAMNILSYLTNN